MTEWFVFKSRKARGRGYPIGKHKGALFVVEKGSTAMMKGTPKVNRYADYRKELLEKRVLVRSRTDPDLYVFNEDYTFSSASSAGGVIIEGNCSGPGRWRHERTGETLRDWKLR